MNHPLALVLTTVSSDDEAESLSDFLITSKYVACINILPNVKSKYIWEDELKNTNEVILLIKTRKDYFKYLEELIKKYHSYKIPEILLIDIADVSTDYKTWIIKNLEMTLDK